MLARSISSACVSAGWRDGAPRRRKYEKMSTTPASPEPWNLYVKSRGIPACRADFSRFVAAMLRLHAAIRALIRLGRPRPDGHGVRGPAALGVFIRQDHRADTTGRPCR